MDLDALLQHYFGTTDLSTISPAELASGSERLTFDFHDERDAGRRFALWTLIFALGFAPDPEDAFETPQERAAARMFVRVAVGEPGDR